MSVCGLVADLFWVTTRRRRRRACPVKTRRRTRRPMHKVAALGIAGAALFGSAGPAAAEAAPSRDVQVAWIDGGRGSFSGTLLITGFDVRDDRLFAVGRLTGTTSGRHNSGTVDQAVAPEVLLLRVDGTTLDLAVGPLEARGSTTDSPQVERVAFDLPSQSGYVELQIADALPRGSPKLHLLRLLNRVVVLSRPGPITGLGGKCLDVAGASTANGTAVQLYECNGTQAQQWGRGRLNLHGPPFRTLHALGKCLDVSGNGTAKWNASPPLGVQRHLCAGLGSAVLAEPPGGIRLEQVPRRRRSAVQRRHEDPDLGLPRRCQPAVGGRLQGDKASGSARRRSGTPLRLVAFCGTSRRTCSLSEPVAFLVRELIEAE